MTFKIKTFQVILVVIALLGLSFWLGGIKYHRQADGLSETVQEANSQLISQALNYQVILDGKRFTVAQQNSVILSQKEAIANGLLDNERLRKLHIKEMTDNVKIKGELSAARDSLKMVNTPTTLIIYKDTIPSTYMKLPFKESYSDNYLDLSFNINTDLTWGFETKFDLDLDMTLGKAKTGFLKTDYSAFVTTDSPYANIINVQSIKIEKRLWYESNAFKALTYGVMFGFGVWVGK